MFDLHENGKKYEAVNKYESLFAISDNVDTVCDNGERGYTLVSVWLMLPEGHRGIEVGPMGVVISPSMLPCLFTGEVSAFKVDDLAVCS